MNLDYGPDSVKTGLFKLMRPLDANDPYEMMGGCKGELTPCVQKQLEDYLRYVWLRESCTRFNTLTIPTLEEVLFRARYQAKAYLRKVIMERHTQENLNRILCFSEADLINSESDQLLWGHYAKGGSGIRIWIDTEKSDSLLPPLIKISYSDLRPIFDLSSLTQYPDDDAMGEFCMSLIKTKSSAWSYEHEIRMFVSARSNRFEIIRENDLEFIKIPHSTIERIDFGPKGIIEDTKKIVDEMREDSTLRHIDFRVATFRDDDYAYDYRPFDELNKQ